MSRTTAGFIALACLVSTASASIVADSFADFSNVQGHLGWTYGYYNTSIGSHPSNPDSFQLMTSFNSSFSNAWDRPSSWAFINSSAMHPHRPAFGRNFAGVLWTTRRWTSDQTGMMNLNGMISSHDLGGDGVNASIWVNGQLIHSYLIRGTVLDVVNYSFDVFITAGDRIDFVVDPRSTVDTDTTLFRSTITPTPSSGMALGAFVLLGAQRRRRASA